MATEESGSSTSSYKPPEPTYLGDGVYARFDGYHVWLSTQEGSDIALEPEVFRSLHDYVLRCWRSTSDS